SIEYAAGMPTSYVGQITTAPSVSIPAEPKRDQSARPPL
ncbi:MAG: hypothetical protein RL653_3552, partial [Pseudomonadota bacterium]